MPSTYIEVGGVLLTAFLMFKQNSHLAEANRIMREHHGITPPVSSWKRVKFYWPLMAMGVFAVVSWVPYFIGAPQQKDVLLNYGMNGDRIFAQVDGGSLIERKPDRLLVVARIGDNSVNFKEDTTIARSAAFVITAPQTNMEVVLSKDFLNRLTQRPAMIDVFIFEVPEEFPIESAKTISDAEKHGAKQLAGKGFGPVQLPSMPPPSSAQ